jgi:hypothetical protein
MLLATDLSAQVPNRFRLGWMAGTQVTHARMQGPESNSSYTNAAPEKVGWIAGMVGQFDIIDNLTIDFSLGFSHDATHVDGNYYSEPLDHYYSIDEYQDFTWIENSVSLLYKFLNKPSFSLYTGAGIDTQFLIESQGQVAVDQVKGPAYESTTYMLRWNYAVPVAAGIEFPLRTNKVSCTFAYHVPLRGAWAPYPISLQGDLYEDGIYRLHAASLTVAYLIALGK